MEYIFDVIYTYVSDYLSKGYNPDDLFYIDLGDEDIIEVGVRV